LQRADTKPPRGRPLDPVHAVDLDERILELGNRPQVEADDCTLDRDA
jgi:hypothetical protein